MQVFQEANITGDSLTHMIHTEDLPLYGDEAAKLVTDAFYDIADTLAIAKDSPTFRVTTKVDGSPSCIAASDYYGKRFVATKGFFSKDRKYAETEEEVKELFGASADLQRKMLLLLNHLDQINIPKNEIWQGDFLFDHTTLFEDVFDGERCLAFHPNTIIYTVPLDDPLARWVRRCTMGIAWHTKYTGNSFDNLKISFDVSTKSLGAPPTVLQLDATIGQLMSKAALTPQEYSETRVKIDKIVGRISSLSSRGVLDKIASSKPLQSYFLMYRNHLIKNMEAQTDDMYEENLLRWVADRFDNEIAKKAQQATKDAYAARRDQELAVLQGMIDDGSMYDIAKLQSKIIELKEFFIQRLETLGSFKTFVNHVDQGYLPTGGEGFAVSDIEGNVQKYVSRLEFSRNNFSQSIVKGWMNDRRKQIKESDSPKEATDRLLRDHNLVRKGRFSKKRGVANTFSTKVVAPPGVSRKEAAQAFVEKEMDVVVDADIPEGDTRPVVTIEVVGAQVVLHFKEAVAKGRGLSARATAEMENVWALFMRKASIGEEAPSYEQAKQMFSEMDELWYDAFGAGADAINEFLLDQPYVFCREDSCHPEKGESIHRLINQAFHDRKDLFAHKGGQKDSWNPSDVYACVEDEYEDICQHWSALAGNITSTLDDLNQFLLDNIQSKKLVGISLKKLSSEEAHLEETNTSKIDIPPTTYQLSSLTITPALVEDGGMAGVRFVLKEDSGREYIGKVRYFGGSNHQGRLGGNLQMEIGFRGAAARIGKVPKAIIDQWAEEFGVTHSKKDDRIETARRFVESSDSPRLEEGGIVSYVEELEHSPIASSITLASLRALRRKLRLVEWDSLSNKNKELLAWLPQSLEIAVLFARAEKAGRLNEFIGSLVDGAKKIAADNAPFIKVS